MRLISGSKTGADAPGRRTIFTVSHGPASRHWLLLTGPKTHLRARRGAPRTD